jgi:hypothetical protein
VAKDYTELRKWIAGGAEPATVVDFSFQPERLREITPKQQSVYKALMALVLRNKAKDFHRGHELTAASIAARRVDDHHGSMKYRYCVSNLDFGLRIASAEPFAADSGCIHLDGSIEFDAVRWSRGHISDTKSPSSSPAPGLSLEGDGARNRRSPDHSATHRE